MAATTREPVKVSSVGDTGIRITSTFKAPRERVFDAFTKPELLKRWFGPPGWTVPSSEIDLRPGGKYRHTIRSAEGQQLVLAGEYREVVRPDRLAATERWEGFSEVGWREEDVTVNTIELTEDEGTTHWTLTIRYASKEVRDEALKTPMDVGMNASFERLDELLATTGDPRGHSEAR